MATSLSELQNLLLDMCSPRPVIDPAIVMELSSDDWKRLLAKAGEHRLMPLLHWRLTNERTDLDVPKDVRSTLARGFKRSGMRSLRMQRELLLIHRHLQKAGIPYLALKGAFLAFHAYPHSALRPMRDLDILVPESMVLTAYQTLIDAGFVRPRQYSGDLGAAAQLQAHLPPLESASGAVTVEVHMRFFKPEENDGIPDAAQDEGIWQRAIHCPMAGEEISYLSPTDLLLHLIEHAVYHHQLDNGPLVLSDIAYLTTRYPIDWRLFWQLVEQRQKRRGVELLLRMVERYFGELPVSWPKEACAADDALHAMIDMSPELMLRNLAGRADTYVACAVQGQQGWREKLSVYWGRMFLSKRQIAVLYPVREDSIFVYFWYLVRAWHLLFRRLPDYLSHRRKVVCQDEVLSITRLNNWLREEG